MCGSATHFGHSEKLLPLFLSWCCHMSLHHPFYPWHSINTWTLPHFPVFQFRYWPKALERFGPIPRCSLGRFLNRPVLYSSDTPSSPDTVVRFQPIVWCSLQSSSLSTSLEYLPTFKLLRLSVRMFRRVYETNINNLLTFNDFKMHISLLELNTRIVFKVRTSGAALKLHTIFTWCSRLVLKTFACLAVSVEFEPNLALTVISTECIDTNVLTAVIFCFTLIMFCSQTTRHL